MNALLLVFPISSFKKILQADTAYHDFRRLRKIFSLRPVCEYGCCGSLRVCSEMQQRCSPGTHGVTGWRQAQAFDIDQHTGISQWRQMRILHDNSEIHKPSDMGFAFL